MRGQMHAEKTKKDPFSLFFLFPKNRILLTWDVFATASSGWPLWEVRRCASVPGILCAETQSFDVRGTPNGLWRGLFCRVIDPYYAAK